MKRGEEMKKVIICLLALLFLGGTALSSAEQIKYTAGGHFFALSKKKTLDRAVYLYRVGDHRSLESLTTTGLIKIFPQGIPVRIYSVRGNIYKVRFLDSRTIWWTTGDALMNRGGENFVRSP